MSLGRPALRADDSGARRACKQRTIVQVALDGRRIIEPMLERTTTLARRIPLPLITSALGALIVAGTMPAWGTGLHWSERGFRYGAGQVALIAGVALIFVSALRADDELDERRYLAAAAGLTLAALGAALWFWWHTVGSVDPVAMRLLAFFDQLPRVGAGAGWYVTLFASAGALAVVTRRLIDRRIGRPTLQHELHWPMRSPQARANTADR
jgi:hypothetical protein